MAVTRPSIQQNFTTFVNGEDLAGQVKLTKVPDIALATEEHIAGGMGGKIDMVKGYVEKMEAEVETDGMGMTRAFSSALGKNGQSLALHAALHDGQRTITHVTEMRGLFVKKETGDFTIEGKGSQKMTATLDYYKETQDGVVVTEVDVMNRVLIIDGVDLLADMRAALGG